MRYYEAIFIAQPSLEQNDLAKLIEETKDLLDKRGSKLLYEEVMGKKRLAYPIQKQRFGTYVLLQFRGDGTSNVRLNQDIKLKDNILAHMIVRIKEDEVREMRAETSEAKLETSADKELTVKTEDEASVAVDDEQDKAESGAGQEEELPDKLDQPSVEEDLEPESKE